MSYAHLAGDDVAQVVGSVDGCILSDKNECYTVMDIVILLQRYSGLMTLRRNTIQRVFVRGSPCVPSLVYSGVPMYVCVHLAEGDDDESGEADPDYAPPSRSGQVDQQASGLSISFLTVYLKKRKTYQTAADCRWAGCNVLLAACTV